MDSPTGNDGITTGTSDTGGDLDTDSTSNYQGVKQWDVRDIACTMGGTLLDDFVTLEFDNKIPISHLKSIKGTIGYCVGFQEPTWTIHLKITSDALPTIMEMKDSLEMTDIVFTAPSYMVTIMGAIISDIKPGSFGSEAPDIAVSGLSMKILEYSQQNIWITQQGTLSANQNTLYEKSGLSNSDATEDTDYAWIRRQTTT